MTERSARRFQILLCNTATQGLDVDEEKTRGIHQGWVVTALPDKAVYMSATASRLVIISDRLANGDGPYMLHISLFVARRYG